MFVGSRVRRSGCVGAAAVLILGGATGCSTGLAPGESGSTTPGSPTAVVSNPQVSSAPATAESVPQDAEPSADPTITTDTLLIATDVVTAFCRPTLKYETWIAELYPFLSQQAAVAYETVDPANVPCRTLLGDATVRDGDGAFTMRILVPTDAGEYSVYVHRPTESIPWAVEQITPLASE